MDIKFSDEKEGQKKNKIIQLRRRVCFNKMKYVQILLINISIIIITIKSRIKMLSYKKSVMSTGKINEDLPTAVKTNYQDYSPYGGDLNTPSLKSPTRYNAKIQEAKNSISSMINEMSNKKNINNQAIERVRNTNADAAAYLRQEEYTTYTPKKSVREPQPIGNRTAGGFGNYGYQQIPDEGRGYSTEFNLHGDDTHYDNVPVAPQYKSLQQENVELRRALNQQIRENNELLKRIRYLEAENEDLRSQLGMGLNVSKGIASTNYNSVNYGDATGTYGAGLRNDYHPSSTTAKFGNRGGQTPIEQYPTEFNQGYQNYNQGLHNQGSGLNVTGNPLFGELDRLKDENEKLRQEAITLLKRHY